MIALDGILSHRLPDDDSAFDWLDTRVRIATPDDRLIARERNLIRGARWRARRAGLTGSFDCQGTLLVLGPGADQRLPFGAALRDVPDVLLGVSLLPDRAGALIRMLARDAAALRTGLQRAWHAARIAVGIRPRRARPK